MLSDVRIDRAVLGIDGEQDGALEAVMLGEDLAELRQRFLGAILLIAADEHDVLALAGTVAAFVDEVRPAAGKRGDQADSDCCPHGSIVFHSSTS